MLKPTARLRILSGRGMEIYRSQQKEELAPDQEVERLLKSLERYMHETFLPIEEANSLGAVVDEIAQALKVLPQPHRNALYMLSIDLLVGAPD